MPKKIYEVRRRLPSLKGYKDELEAVFFTEDEAWNYIDMLAEQRGDTVYDWYTVDTTV